MTTIKLSQDSFDSPREWDNIGTIAYNHGSYNLGEEKISDPIDWLIEKLELSEEYIYNKCEGYSNETLVKLEEKFFKKFIALPVYIYDHSGQSISTSPFNCRWDSGKLGYIYCSKEKAIQEFGGKVVTKETREKVLSNLELEIETFNQYIQGDVYSFEVLDEDENHIDSCGGFYGTDWETNGMLDHIDYEGYGWTKEETIEKLQEAYNNI